MLANSYVGTQPSHWAQPLVNSSTHTHWWVETPSGRIPLSPNCLLRIRLWQTYYSQSLIMCYIYVRLRTCFGPWEARQVNCTARALPGRRFGNLSAESSRRLATPCFAPATDGFSISQCFPWEPCRIVAACLAALQCAACHTTRLRPCVARGLTSPITGFPETHRIARTARATPRWEPTAPNGRLMCLRITTTQTYTWFN